MSFNLSPIGNDQQIDANGDPLVGGSISVYLAGSSTPTTTYCDALGITPQSWPIVLNSLGLPDSTIWLTGNVFYKFVVKSSSGSVLRTIDDVAGINDISTTVSIDEWVTSGAVPTYISGTSFSVVGDRTDLFLVGRRLKSSNTAGTVYSNVATSSFAAGVTTVTVTNDSLSLDAGISTIYYGLISPNNSSLPNSAATRAALGVAAKNEPQDYAGATLQTVTATDAGSSTTSTALVNVSGSVVTITPKSTASKLLITCIFQGSSAAFAGANTVASFRIFESTTALGTGEMTIGASTASGGTGSSSVTTVQAVVTNTALTARSFKLHAKTSNASSAAGATLQNWTITEIKT